MFYKRIHEGNDEEIDKKDDWLKHGKNASLLSNPGEIDVLTITNLLVSVPYRGYIVPSYIDIANGGPSHQIVFRTIPERKFIFFVMSIKVQTFHVPYI